MRTLQMGRVRVTVRTHSSTGMPLAIMVAMILEVSVERIFALTPLPRPSASTRVVLSSNRTVSTRSPQSSSPFLMRLT